MLGPEMLIASLVLAMVISAFISAVVAPFVKTTNFTRICAWIFLTVFVAFAIVFLAPQGV